MSPLSSSLRAALLATLVVLASCSQAHSWQDSAREGRLALQRGDNQEACAFFTKAVETAKSSAAVSGVGGTNSIDLQIAPVYLELARAELALKNEGKARAALDAAVACAIAGGGKNSEQLIPIYKESAKLFYRKKDFANSQIAAIQALRLEKECCGAGSQSLLDSLNLAISAACAQDRCADTGPLLIEQLQIRREHLGPDHPHVAVSLCLLGELAEKKGQWKEAESRYLEAVAIRKKSEPGLVTQTEKNLARVRERLREKNG